MKATPQCADTCYVQAAAGNPSCSSSGENCACGSTELQDSYQSCLQWSCTGTDFSEALLGFNQDCAYFAVSATAPVVVASSAQVSAKSTRTSTTTASNATSTNQPSGGLTISAWTGIGAGILVVIINIVLTIVICNNRRRKRKRLAMEPYSVVTEIESQATDDAKVRFASDGKSPGGLFSSAPPAYHRSGDFMELGSDGRGLYGAFPERDTPPKGAPPRSKLLASVAQKLPARESSGDLGENLLEDDGRSDFTVPAADSNYASETEEVRLLPARNHSRSGNEGRPSPLSLHEASTNNDEPESGRESRLSVLRQRIDRVREEKERLEKIQQLRNMEADLRQELLLEQRKEGIEPSDL